MDLYDPSARPRPPAPQPVDWGQHVDRVIVYAAAVVAVVAVLA